MLSKVFVVGSVFGALALVLGGCSSDSKPATVPASINHPDIGSFCAAIGIAECSDTLLSNCGLSDKTACQGAVQSQCSSGTSDITFGRNTMSYQNKKGDDCIKAVQDAYADGVVDSGEYAKIRTSCDIAFSQLRDVGADCAIDADCDLSAGLVCSVTGTKLSCQKPGTKVKGDDCSQAPCAPGLVCVGGAAGICTDGREMGSQCTLITNPCKTTLLCEAGTCVAKLVTKDPCVTSEQCASGFCARVPDISNPMMPNPNSRQCLDKLVYGTGAPLCQNFTQK